MIDADAPRDPTEAATGEGSGTTTGTESDPPRAPEAAEPSVVDLLFEGPADPTLPAPGGESTPARE